MKANQIESCQKCFLVKIYKWHKKLSHTDLIKKKTWRGVFEIDVCAAAKHKSLTSLNFLFYKLIFNNFVKYRSIHPEVT